MSDNPAALNLDPIHKTVNSKMGFSYRSQKDVRQFAREAEIDSLTGLANRARLFRDITAIHQNMERGISSYAIMFLDLDNFKVSVNDIYGHLAGNTALREFAKVINSSIRKSDTAYRFGGDEFVILVNDVDPDKVDETSGSIRGRLNDELDQIKLKDGRFSDIGISVGTYTPINGESVDAALEKADLLMYRDKADRKAAR